MTCWNCGKSLFLCTLNNMFSGMFPLLWYILGVSCALGALLAAIINYAHFGSIWG